MKIFIILNLRGFIQHHYIMHFTQILNRMMFF